MSYHSRLHYLLCDVLTPDAFNGSADRVVTELEKAILELNHEILERERLRHKESNAHYTAPGAIAELQKAMGPQ